MFKEQLLNKFATHGFNHVKLNLWQGRRLYANIKGLPVIIFDLEKSHGKQTYNCQITTKEMVNPATFRNLLMVSYFLKQHGDEVKELFAENSYIMNK